MAKISKNWLIAGAAAAALYCVHKIKANGVGLLSYLQARYDSRASFYNKAALDDDGRTITLYSYTTPVAKYNRADDTLEVYGWYSATTSRHIREFARQLGFDIPSGSDIKGTYTH